jgi:hypothetical protein
MLVLFPSVGIPGVDCLVSGTLSRNTMPTMRLEVMTTSIYETGTAVMKPGCRRQRGK